MAWGETRGEGRDGVVEGVAVRSVFRFLFSRPRLAESRQIYYFFRCRRRRRTVCV